MAGGVFFLAYRPLLLARTGVGLESTEVISIAERALLNAAAYTAIRESPLLGTGAGNFPWRASYYFFDSGLRMRGQNVHHVLLGVWAEAGFIGFAWVAIAIIAGVSAALRQIKSGSDGMGRGVLLTGFIALAVVGLFDHYPWTILHFQAAWWGLLAVAMRDEIPSLEMDIGVPTQLSASVLESSA
jgi:O-antigen ligase